MTALAFLSYTKYYRFKNIEVTNPPKKNIKPLKSI
jgi:hypothetical protein